MLRNKLYKTFVSTILCIELMSGFGLAQEIVPTEQRSPDKIILDALELRDMDINDVLKLIASKSGLNIIAGKSVTGKVTIYLKNVEVHDALMIILKANGLAYVEDEGVMQIMTDAEFEKIYGYKFGRNTVHKTITLVSMKTADAVVLLNQIKSSVGKVIADDQSGTLMLEDTPDRMDAMINYLKDVDQPTKWQVYEVKNVPVEGLANKITEQVSTKIGAIKFDASSNKLFIKDTPARLENLNKLINEIDVPRVTRVFDISYAKAEDISKMVTPLLTKDIGNIQFDARFNKIIVTDIAPRIEAIESIIASVDKKEKEVLIDARIIEIKLDDSYKMGIDWSAIIKQYKNKATFTNDFSLSPTTSPTQSILTVGTGSYQAVLNMIASMGKSKTLSNPHIVVVNNQEAKILVGSNQPYATSSTTTPSTGAATTANAVNFIEVGVKLHVTPTIHDDKYITMKIHPEVSSKEATDYTYSSNGALTSVPVIDTSEVDTIVSVKDGVTIVIGGLIKDEVDHNKDKIPMFGDIPLVGKMFRREERSMIKTETVIFLTPHIITGDTNVEPDKSLPMELKPNKTYYSPIHEES